MEIRIPNIRLTCVCFSLISCTTGFALYIHNPKEDTRKLLRNSIQQTTHAMAGCLCLKRFGHTSRLDDHFVLASETSCESYETNVVQI